MKSPRFVLREAEIKEVFSSSRLKHTWKHKVRAKMRNHFLPDPKAVSGVRKIMMAPNTSKRLGITHAKFLMLLSILANSSISVPDKRRYIHVHRLAWRDAFYRWRARVVVRPT